MLVQPYPWRHFDISYIDSNKIDKTNLRNSRDNSNNTNKTKATSSSSSSSSSSSNKNDSNNSNSSDRSNSGTKDNTGPILKYNWNEIIDSQDEIVDNQVEIIDNQVDSGGSYDKHHNYIPKGPDGSNMEPVSPNRFEQILAKINALDD